MKKILLVLAFIITLLAVPVKADIIKVATLRSGPQKTSFYFDYDRVHYRYPKASKEEVLTSLCVTAWRNEVATIYALRWRIKASEVIKLKDTGSLDLTNDVIDTIREIERHDIPSLDLHGFNQWNQSFFNRPVNIVGPHQRDE